MNINPFFTIEKVVEFKKECPFFPHPYEYLHQDFKPLEEAISRVNNHSLHQRICDLKGTDEVTKFYGLISELKVALLLHEKGINFECSKEGGNSRATPDFKVMNDGEYLYIEVNTPLKSIPHTDSIERKFKNNNRNRNKFIVANRLPKIENYSDAESVFNAIEFAIKNSNDNSVFYEDEEREIRFWYNEPFNTYSGFNRDKITNLIRHFLNESITNKIDREKSNEEKIKLKNNLNNSHPNILWSEFNFLLNVQEAIAELHIISEDVLTEIFSAHSLPKDIDAQTISISNLTDSFKITANGYLPLFYIFINENSKYKENIKSFIDKILPNVNQFLIKNEFDYLKKKLKLWRE